VFRQRVCPQAARRLPKAATASSLFAYTSDIVSRFVRRSRSVTRLWGETSLRSPIGSAYAMQGETAKARAAYQDFLTLWKDADPDIPILKEAKAEYEKLQ
jgi:hypothetical protein